MSAGGPAVFAWCFSLAALVFGYLLISFLLGRGASGPLRLALAFPAFMLFVLIVMLIHILSQGEVFSSPWVVRGLGAGALFLLVAASLRRKVLSAEELRGKRGLALLLVAIVAVVLWWWPAWRAYPGPVTYDLKLHMAWASQLMNGESTPSAPTTLQVPNYYPWLYHALAAFGAAFAPGGRPWHTLLALQLLFPLSAAFALYYLGEKISGRVSGGLLAAIFAGLSGGLGWVEARAPGIIFNPRSRPEGYLGDLVFVRSYSFPFQNLAPPFPRDLGFVLLLAALALLAQGTGKGDRSACLFAGVFLGMSGLAGPDGFIVGFLALTAGVLFAGSRRRLFALALLTGGLVFLLWAGPLSYNYVRLGGFRNTTQIGPVNVPWWAVLGAWGAPLAVVPLGVVAAYRDWRRRKEGMWLVLFVAASAVTVAASSWGESGSGFSTLGRAHRYWPLLHLGIALLGAWGGAYLLSWGRQGLMVVSLICLAALPSPLLGGLALKDEVPEHPLLAETIAGKPTLLSALRPWPARCVAVAPQGLRLDVFAYTGYRLVHFVPDRIRWRVTPRLHPSTEARREANIALLWGENRHVWLEAARRFDVDLVLARKFPSGLPVTREGTFSTSTDGEVTLLRRDNCEGE